MPAYAPYQNRQSGPGTYVWQGSPQYRSIADDERGPSVHPSGYSPQGSYGYTNGRANPTPIDYSRTGAGGGGAYQPRSFNYNPQTSYQGGGSSGTSSPGVSTLTRVKNPALDNAQGQALSGASSTSNANGADLSRYSNAIGQNAADNNFFYNQESGSLGDIYNGRALNSLNSYTGNYANQASGLTGQLGADLSAGRDAYGGSETAAINKESADRSGMESAYKGTAQGTLDNAIQQLGTNRAKYATAAQQGTNFAIADADKQRKAQQAAMGGYGGLSYFNRQAADVRQRASSALQQDLANRERQDFGVTHGEQVQLNADLADRSRADYGLTREESARLASNLNSQQRGDTGYIYGQNAGVNRDVLGNNVNAYQFVSGQQGRLAGLRGRIGADNANQLLGPINARNQNTNAQLSQLGALGQIDRGNRFYGLDDGSAGTSYFNPAGAPPPRGRPAPYPNPYDQPDNQQNPRARNQNPQYDQNGNPIRYDQDGNPIPAGPNDMPDNLNWNVVGDLGGGAYQPPNNGNLTPGGGDFGGYGAGGGW